MQNGNHAAELELWRTLGRLEATQERHTEIALDHLGETHELRRDIATELATLPQRIAAALPAPVICAGSARPASVPWAALVRVATPLIVLAAVAAAKVLAPEAVPAMLGHLSPK